MASSEDGQLIRLEFTSDEACAAYWVGRLEKRAADLTGLSREQVRPQLARQIGISPGTIENLLRKRIKAIKSNVYKRIIAAADRELRKEIARLEHERTFLATQADHTAQRDLREVDAALQAARSALGES